MATLSMAADAPPRDPGAPIGKDELDPELVSLRRGAPTVGVVTSAAIVILCVVLMVRLRHDLAFSRSGDTPRQVTVEDVVAGKVGDDSYVSLRAPLDRASAVRARVTEANAGTRVLPVLGSGDRLWLAVPGDPWSPVSHDDVVSGRLRPLAAVRFADPVVAYVARNPVPRFISGAELRAARLGGKNAVTLVGGGTLTVAPTDQVELMVADPGAAIVVATFNPRLPDVKAWGEALAAAGVVAAGTAPIRTSDDTARWEVRQPDAVAAVGRALEAAQLWGARVEAASTQHKVAFGELPVTEAGVGLPGGVIPWSAVDVVAVHAPRPVPAGARVLLLDEKPAAYWYLTPVYVVLAVFALLFTWALTLAVRRLLR